jgi:hypothetical protein
MSLDAVATTKRSGAGSVNRSLHERERREKGSDMSGNLGFTFTMDVMPGTQVHFTGAPWPVQAENKMSSAQVQNQWKTRVSKITRALSKEEATERKHVRYNMGESTGASQEALDLLVQAEPDSDDRAQAEPD